MKKRYAFPIVGILLLPFLLWYVFIPLYGVWYVHAAKFSPASEWKTHTNKDLGFSFKYPPEFFSVYDGGDHIVLRGKNAGQVDFSIYQKSNELTTSFHQTISKEGAKAITYPGGQEYRYETAPYYGDWFGWSCGSITDIWERPDYFISIHRYKWCRRDIFSYGEVMGNRQDLFDQILSTFRFEK